MHILFDSCSTPIIVFPLHQSHLAWKEFCKSLHEAYLQLVKKLLLVVVGGPLTLDERRGQHIILKNSIEGNWKWIVCNLSINELPFRHLILKLDGKIFSDNSLSGKLVRSLVFQPILLKAPHKRWRLCFSQNKRVWRSVDKSSLGRLYKWSHTNWSGLKEVDFSWH